MTTSTVAQMDALIGTREAAALAGVHPRYARLLAYRHFHQRLNITTQDVWPRRIGRDWTAPASVWATLLTRTTPLTKGGRPRTKHVDLTRPTE